MKHSEVGLYVIFDNKAQAPAGNSAYYFRATAAAVRFFIDCLTTKDTTTNQHQEDYDLYLMGDLGLGQGNVPALEGPDFALQDPAFTPGQQIILGELIMTGKAAKASIEAATQTPENR